MPDPQPPDYDALAAQHGGVDYDALAKQAQAGDDKPPSVPASMWDTLKAIGHGIDAFEMGAANKTVEALPAIGATAGSILGGMAGNVPGAVTGASLGGAAGAAGKQLLDRVAGRPAPDTALAAAKDIGTQGVEQGVIQAAGEGIGRAAAPMMQWAGGRLMQSALKPDLEPAAKAALKGKLPPVVQTMLDEGVNVTSGGISKLQDILGQTNQAVKDTVQNMTGTIDRPVVAARAATVAKSLQNQTNPNSDLKALGGMVDDFLNPSVMQGSLSPQEAQAMKVGTYRQIGDRYGTPAQYSPAEVQAQMAFARGLKEEIENLATAQGLPNVKTLNAREGNILEALQATAKRVAVARNANPAGFAFAAHGPSAFLSALVDRSPAAKSLLGRGLYQAAGMATGLSPSFLRAAVSAVGSLQDEPDSTQP